MSSVQIPAGMNNTDFGTALASILAWNGVDSASDMPASGEALDGKVTQSKWNARSITRRR